MNDENENEIIEGKQTKTARGDQASSFVAREKNGNPSMNFPKILTDFPEKMPVFSEEVDIIQTYLFDILNTIIANDN